MPISALAEGVSGADYSWVTGVTDALTSISSVFSVFPYNALIGLTFVGIVAGLVARFMKRP